MNTPIIDPMIFYYIEMANRLFNMPLYFGLITLITFLLLIMIFSDNDKFILPSTIYAHFKRICKNAEIKVTTTKKKKRHKDGKEVYVNLKTSAVSTHMLRHTFATRCIEAGINPVVLQKILGHKDIQVTLNTYTDVFNKFKNKEIEKIETYFSQLH